MTEPASPASLERLSVDAMQAIEQENWAQAESILQRLTRTRGAPPEASYNLALVLPHVGKAAQVGRWLRRAIDARPDYLAAWFELGRWLIDRRDLAAARDAFSRVTELAPDNRDGWRNLARVAERLSDYAVARDAWRRLGDAPSSDVEIQVGLMRALLELRDPEGPALFERLWAQAALRPHVLRAVTRSSAGRLPLSTAPADGGA